MPCLIPAKKSCSSNLFGAVPSWAAQTALMSELSKAITFFVLGPILVKFHIRTRRIDGLPPKFQSWWCAEEKLHFTPFPTLHQLKRDEALFPPLERVVDFRARYQQIPVGGFWIVGKIWRPCDLRSRSYKRLYTHLRTHRHAHKAL